MWPIPSGPASGKRKKSSGRFEINRQGEDELFHDEKNFARFVREMTSRFPRLAEATPESAADKNELINISKANEVHSAVVNAC
jgi:hypothetical protein